MNLPNKDEAKKRNKSKVEYIYQDNYIGNELINKKYFIKTYGCQMNVHDSEELSAYLENLGATKTEEMDNADIIVLNTCAIRENAHDKVFGFLGRSKHLKKEKKETIVCIAGCMSQEEGVVDEIKTKHPYVDIVIGTHNINVLPEMILKCKHKQDIEVISCEGNVYSSLGSKLNSLISESKISVADVKNIASSLSKMNDNISKIEESFIEYIESKDKFNDSARKSLKKNYSFFRKEKVGLT